MGVNEVKKVAKQNSLAHGSTQKANSSGAVGLASSQWSKTFDCLAAMRMQQYLRRQQTTGRAVELFLLLYRNDFHKSGQNYLQTKPRCISWLSYMPYKPEFYQTVRVSQKMDQRNDGMAGFAREPWPGLYWSGWPFAG